MYATIGTRNCDFRWRGARPTVVPSASNPPIRLVVVAEKQVFPKGERNEPVALCDGAHLIVKEFEHEPVFESKSASSP
jgi:hypothetical protein